LDYLNSWISNIIVLIFLLIVIELLLPNNTFQRYVSMVAGLVLLLTMLQPILSVFDIDVDNVISSFSDTSILNEEQMKNSIDENTKIIETSQLEHTQDVMTKQMKKDVEKELAYQYDLAIKGLNITLNPESKNPIKLVDVTLEQANNKIAVIEEVQVDVKNSENEKENYVEETELTNDVKELLSKKWDISKNLLTVHIQNKS
jgi:stage III sporulation protein AF